MARILVVDDSATMRQMLGYTLERVGHEVIEACDGEAALERAEAQPFDLIITDVNMPGMNGLELTSQLRQRQLTRATPVLVLTTESEAQKKEQGRAAGATGWIVKPFDPDALLKVLPRVLGPGV